MRTTFLFATVCLAMGCEGGEAVEIATARGAIISENRFGWAGYDWSNWSAGDFDQTNLGAGRTRFRFFGVGSAIGLISNAQAIAAPPQAGPEASYCKHESTSMSGSDLDIYVHCYHWNGTDSTTMFPGVFWVAASQPAKLGYLMTHGPSGSVYAYNFTGGSTWFSNPSTGHYSVQFAGMTGTTGTNAQVTASGANANRCQIASWAVTTGTVNVVCTTPGGTPVNTDFNLMYTMGGLAHDGNLGALWSGDTSAGTHTPSAVYSLNTWGGTNRVTNDGTWIISYANFDTGFFDRSAINAATLVLTSYGGAGEFCNQQWYDYSIGVRCYHADGSQFIGRYTAALLSSYPF